MSQTTSYNVVLVHHPTNNINRPIYFVAMGLFSIADYLDRNGFKTQIIHVGIEKEIDPDFELVNCVVATGAAIIGFSAHWFFQLPESLAAAEQLKKKMPQSYIVFGGFSASFFSKEIINDCPYVDAVIRGDGEVPMLALCEKILTDTSYDLSSVPNLVYRNTYGSMKQSPFCHVASEDQLREYIFSRMNLLRHYETYLKNSSFWTRRFRQRFQDGGLFFLETGRGCPHLCVFCGGNNKAQIAINNRKQPVFRNPDSVISTIEGALGYGYRNFYICFDPYPNESYYFDLFRRIKEKRLELRLCFGSWRLPSAQLINTIRETFVDCIFEISPETSSESLRKYNKGALTYSNQELEQTIINIHNNGLSCQLYFGYFLPGDTVDTVHETRQFARAHESDFCETFYLPLSTDPASLFYLEPDTYRMHVGIRTLKDYVMALSRERIASNLLEHRPVAIEEEAAKVIITKLQLEHVLHNIFSATLKSLNIQRRCNNRYLDIIDAFHSYAIKNNHISNDSLRTADLIDAFKNFLKSNIFKLRRNLLDMIFDIAEYESIPYLLYAERFGEQGTHYSFTLQALKMDIEDIQKLLRQNDVACKTHVFHHDVKLIVGDVQRETNHMPKPRGIKMGFLVERTKKFTTFYFDDMTEEGSCLLNCQELNNKINRNCSSFQ